MPRCGLCERFCTVCDTPFFYELLMTRSLLLMLYDVAPTSSHDGSSTEVVAVLPPVRAAHPAGRLARWQVGFISMFSDMMSHNQDHDVISHIPSVEASELSPLACHWPFNDEVAVLDVHHGCLLLR